MHASHATGQSSANAAEALATALSNALVHSTGSAHTHIYITGITHVGNEWQATVSTVVEPKAETPQAAEKSQKAQAPDTALDTVFKDGEKKELQRIHDRCAQQHCDEEEAEEHNRAHRREEIEKFVELELLILYLESVYEQTFRAIEPQFDFDAVHILDGALWEEALRHSPDIELYEAAHAVEAPEPKNRPPAFSKPEKRLVYAEELVDE